MELQRALNTAYFVGWVNKGQFGIDSHIRSINQQIITYHPQEDKNVTSY